MVKQFQLFRGQWCRIVRTEVIFLLQVIQLGDNSEKLLGFRALHFHLPSKKVTIFLSLHSHWGTVTRARAPVLMGGNSASCE